MAAMCHYEGRHYAEGAVVPVRAPCLRCRCGRGAISCRRRTCTAPPAPAEPCQSERSRDACCPHLHCSDFTDIMERVPDIITKYEEVYSEVVKSHTHEHPVCEEEGTVYAAGSAMGSATACEQCFCLGGARRCVRPQCLRPPLGCRARPAPGVCCPQRYYCEHPTTKPPDEHHLHDCQVEGQWVAEGERVEARDGAACSQCFCLRGAVRCQALACAPPLLGCRPLLEAGQCCPHQYQCVFQQRQGLPDFHTQPILDNTLSSFQNKDRSFRSAPPIEQYNVTKALSITVTDKTTTSLMGDEHDSTATTKVKRKTSDSSTQTTSKSTEGLTTATATAQTTTKVIVSTDRTTSQATEASTPEEDATEQPESSVKIIINGTINCTAELSTTTVTINSTKANETENYSDVENIQARIPNIAQSFESHTYNPNDIITDRNYNEDFDENESYIINVTSSLISSLRTNNTLSSPAPSATKVTNTEAADTSSIQNSSKKTKDEYEYYYNKPTLPPSLPNLKIIPFVAADAVVDDDTSSKKSHAYPIVDRHDKYPVYYPSGEGKDDPFATRREDLYNPTQFPIFLSKNIESAQYPLSAHEVHLTNEYPSNGDIITSVHEYSVTTALGSDLTQANKATTKLPGHNTKFELDTPVVNLFSPPVETEGGFIPKDPAIIDDFYALYTSSTPAGANVPHLTTSMQLDTTKECVSEDGQRVVEGEAISLACSVCTCAWGELQCSARPCDSPPGCRRRPTSASSQDLCCGDLICNSGNKTTPFPQFLSTRSVPVILLVNKSQEISANSSDVFTELSIVDNTTLQSYTPTTAPPKIITTMSSTVVNEERFKSEVTNINLEQSSTEKNEQSSKPTTVAVDSEKDNDNSQEYDDDSDDDGFSLGSVLKLLLSDSYATTTAAPVKQSTVPVTHITNIVTKTTQAPKTTTKRQPFKSSSPLASVTNRPPYMPVKHHQPQSAVNRIDHLILGESTAIKKMTPRPATVPFKPIPTRKPAPAKMSTSEKPFITTKPVEVTKKTDYVQYTSITQDNVRPSTSNHLSGGLGPGFLKLAGCNIYGKMYRVERIIAELSSSCQECRCTELGVQCRQLGCSNTTG
ncbi:Cysteine-rich motor neuron 1 protein [Papilio machaon]|uniref:Cysteine-rich motor neuron 1 protein n=1 Tax=Papilio machaon TaxID=76193 RepID=A0A0N0PBW2_PAPMA|nr:Cysteine-rich motor neuron 1 protein [Papilio machaon]